MEKSRRKIIESKRVVIKVGTSSLMQANGRVNYQQFDRLAFVLSTLNQGDKEIILVSSGAIGVGLNKLALHQRPQTISQQQAVAAVGQSELMNLYSRFFAHYQQTVGQILMTRDIVEFPTSHQNVVNTLETLLAMKIIPVVNENDTVAVDELAHATKFGDNDQLSAIVAEICQADLLIMLSDVAGFFDKNPAENPDAVLYATIHEVTDALMAKAGGQGSTFGTGGMLTKLKAAKRILANGQGMVLAQAQDPALLFNILAGEKIGTYFIGANKKGE